MAEIYMYDAHIVNYLIRNCVFFVVFTIAHIL